MTVVIESPQGAESIFATGPIQAPLRPVVRGRPAERWKSGLSSGDLQCLLRVIEDELIPRLLTEYSPARHAPLRSDDPSG